MTIYKCNICGNIITMLDDKGVIPSCCGETMTLLKAKTSDDYAEKHVPVISRDGSHVTVTVGSVLHPMADAHRIDWIGLETDKGFHIIYLAVDAAPLAKFVPDEDEKIKAAYAYCNVHGLWKGECL